MTDEQKECFKTLVINANVSEDYFNDIKSMFPEVFETPKPERKFIDVRVASDYDLSLKDIDDNLHGRLGIGGSFNIKVTEIKPPSPVCPTQGHWEQVAEKYYKENESLKKQIEHYKNPLLKITGICNDVFPF